MPTTYGPLVAEMTWTELRDAVADGYGVLLPVGAIEQHGPHLPLATDVLLPLAVAGGVAEQTRTLIAAPFHYGYKSAPLSGGGQGFPGTTSLRGSTLVGVVQDLVSEFIRSGFKKITLINWHGENRGFLYEGVDLAMRENPGSGARVILMNSVLRAIDEGLITPMFPEGFPGWDVEHASVIETSMMLALYPRLVRLDKVLDDRAGRHPPYDMFPPPADTIPDSGVLYQATRGTREKGEELYRAAVDVVVSAIRREFDDTESRQDQAA